MDKLNIISLDHNGRGIGKINNKIIFVENALPNEIITYKIDKDKKRYFEGSVVDIIKKSNERINVECPYYDHCGGCNLMHINYSNQLKYKEEKINNIINKYLGNNIKINKIVCSDFNFNYRNKVTFQVKEKIGFYNNRSSTIIYIDNCLLANKKINDLIPYLNKLELNNIKNITCRTNDNDIMIIISIKDIIDENLVIKILKDKCSSIIINYKNNYKCIYGENYIINNIGNLKYYVTNDGFFQINNNVTYKMYSKIKDYCNLKGNEKILDLYCGSGTIGLFLSDKCKKVLGIEINKYSIICANKNKELNNINNCEFICSDTNDIKLNDRFDIIVVDPPRSGLSKKTIGYVNNLKPKKIIYVSCDPMTLVRDLKILNNNYDILEITPFDMFPNTYHIECVCVLKLKESLLEVYMNKYKKILVSDYDQTFYLNDDDIEKNKIAINNFRKNGNIFVIATGRSYFDFQCKVDLYKLNYDYVIINHGATILDKNNNVIANFPIRNEVISDIKNDLQLQKSIEKFCCSKLESRVDFDYKDLTKINVKYASKDMAMNVNKNINDKYSKFVNSYYVTKNSVEIISNKINKAKAIDLLLVKLNILRKNVYTIGDGYSDIEMIRKFNGYCMKKSIDKLKNISKKEYNSVSELINKII